MGWLDHAVEPWVDAAEVPLPARVRVRLTRVRKHPFYIRFGSVGRIRESVKVRVSVSVSVETLACPVTNC